MKHATTPNTPTTAPNIAERTGTARRPRPGSTASRDPISSTGDSSREVHRTNADGRPDAFGRRDTTNQPVSAATAIVATTNPAIASPITAQSTCTPRWRS